MDLAALSNGLHGSVQMDSVALFLWIGWLRHHGILRNANDFGSIIRNQGYFQRGVIHNIVDETDFKWKVGEEENEHK